MTRSSSPLHLPVGRDRGDTDGARPCSSTSTTRTGNIDPDAIAAAVTPATRAISIVHYGGVAARIDEISSVAAAFQLPVIEDNAHGLAARYRGQRTGDLRRCWQHRASTTRRTSTAVRAALPSSTTPRSWSGPRSFARRAPIGRSSSAARWTSTRGGISGSSYLMSELSAALLSAQLDEFEEIQKRRHHVWDRYRGELADWAARTDVRLMNPPAETEHPAHLFYLILADREDRDAFIAHMHAREIIATFHFVPLDSSPAGQRFARSVGTLDRARDFSDRLARLPLWPAMTETEISRVIDAVTDFTPRAHR